MFDSCASLVRVHTSLQGYTNISDRTNQRSLYCLFFFQSLLMGSKVLSLMFLMLAVVMTMARPVEEDGRRQLGGGGGFISYDALKADSVPCNQRGASYYGCRSASGPVNPYRRECSTATNCQRSTG